MITKTLLEKEERCLFVPLFLYFRTTETKLFLKYMIILCHYKLFQFRKNQQGHINNHNHNFLFKHISKKL